MKHEVAAHTLLLCVCVCTVKYFKQRLKANGKLSMHRRLIFWIFEKCITCVRAILQNAQKKYLKFTKLI